jgi:phage terminase large subunit-like protein
MEKIIDVYRKTRPPSYTDAWHLDEMFKAVNLSYEKRFWLVLEKAVRHGGSEVCNIYGPTGRLAVNPREQFSVICAEQRLAAKFTRASRAVIQHQNYPVPYKLAQPDTQLEWTIDTGQVGNSDATYFASGIDGMRQGRGCTVGIVDDVYKSGFQARSQATREKYHDTVQNSVINRLTPDGILHILGARIHPADEQGTILQMEADGLLPPLGHLRLPATNDSGQDAFFRYGDDIHYFGPYKEDALWPLRYSRKKLDAIRKSVSEAWWQSQYQQSPNLAGQPFFNLDTIPRWDSNVPLVSTWSAWDLAMTITTSGSYSAGCVMGLGADGRIYLLKALRFRGLQEEMEKQILLDWELSGRTRSVVIVEKAAAGYGILERLGRTLPVAGANTRGMSKEDRAASVCSLINGGRVVFPKEGLFPWQVWAEEDVRSYPMVKQSDFIDAMVYALAWPSMPGLFLTQGKVDTMQSTSEWITIDDPRHPGFDINEEVRGDSSIIDD